MRFRRRPDDDIHAAKENSFLDIAASLAGIFVILVTVIGLRLQDARQANVPTDLPPASEQLAREKQQVQSEHDRLTSSAYEVQRKAEQMAALLDLRGSERHQLQVLMTAARMELDERRAQLSAAQQDQVALASEARELKAELAKVAAQRQTLERDSKRPVELEHLPTPLAKTVFGSEEHFRLKGRRLVYVPLNELTELLRAEVPQKVYRLKEVPQMTETIGPVQGFHLRYTLQRRTLQTATAAGTLVRQMGELKQFVLVPMSEDMGEPIDQALAAGSQFRQMVESMRPEKTVITVWTYPDSYADFRKLKQWLFDRGFATAARPLPEDQPISGSPTGSRSAAQ
jgi:hypothetical protein